MDNYWNLLGSFIGGGISFIAGFIWRGFLDRLAERKRAERMRVKLSDTHPDVRTTIFHNGAAVSLKPGEVFVPLDNGGSR